MVLVGHDWKIPPASITRTKVRLLTIISLSARDSGMLCGIKLEKFQVAVGETAEVSGRGEGLKRCQIPAVPIFGVGFAAQNAHWNGWPY